MKSLAVLVLLLLASPSFAGLDRFLSEKDYVNEASAIAANVDAFQAVFKKYPQAKIYGGAPRDFLLWLNRQFDSITSKDDALKKLKDLKKGEAVSADSFLLEHSDIDLILDEELKSGDKDEVLTYAKSKRTIQRINGKRYFSDLQVQTELAQGYAPAEKLYFDGKKIHSAPKFSDGLNEFYHDSFSLTLTEPSKFWESHYAKLKLNHPILISLRYLRILSQSGRSQRSPLERDTLAQIKSSIETWKKDGHFQECLTEVNFVKFLEKSISTVAHTHQVAGLSLKLLKDSGIHDWLSQAHPNYANLVKSCEEKMMAK